MASSALNRRILDLEAELQCELFERLPRGVRLTAAGELFVDYVRRAMTDLETVSSRIEQLRGLVRGRVQIAAVESVGASLLPSAITQFQQKHPRVRFDVRIGAPGELLKAMLEDEADLILTHDTRRDTKLTVVSTVSRPLCALVAATHPLSAVSKLRLRDCIAHPIALGDQTLAGRALIEQALAKSSLRIEPALISNSVEAMKEFSRLNGGVCFQFCSPKRERLAGGDMVAIPLSEPVLANAQLVMMTRRNRVLPFAAAAFVEHMSAFLANEVRQ